MFETLFRELRTQWKNLVRAPLAFVLATVCGAALAWITVAWAYEHQLAALRDQVGAVNELIRAERARTADFLKVWPVREANLSSAAGGLQCDAGPTND